MGSGWVLNPMRSPRERGGVDAETQRGRPCEDGADWADTSTSQETSSVAGSHLKPEESRGRVLRQSFWKEPHPATPWFLLSGPQNCESINFCCFTPPNSWYFVTEPSATNTGPLQMLGFKGRAQRAVWGLSLFTVTHVLQLCRELGISRISQTSPHRQPR